MVRSPSSDPPFQPRPSLKLVANYLVSECVRRYPLEKCPLCSATALPEDPKVCVCISFLPIGKLGIHIYTLVYAHMPLIAVDLLTSSCSFCVVFSLRILQTFISFRFLFFFVSFFVFFVSFICSIVLFQDIVTDESDAQFVYRVYCSHLYHRSCLEEYMKTPPFEGVCIYCVRPCTHIVCVCRR